MSQGFRAWRRNSWRASRYDELRRWRTGASRVLHAALRIYHASLGLPLSAIAASFICSFPPLNFWHRQSFLVVVDVFCSRRPSSRLRFVVSRGVVILPSSPQISGAGHLCLFKSRSPRSLCGLSFCFALLSRLSYSLSQALLLLSRRGVLDMWGEHPPLMPPEQIEVVPLLLTIGPGDRCLQ